MSNYEFVPSPNQALTTEEEIRAYVNPTRITILTLLASEKNSVSGIARQLGVHPANLTYHFKLLEKAGLIQLVEKRETGKNLEKIYRAVAYQFTIHANPENSNKKALALELLRDDLTSTLHIIDRQPDERAVLGILKTVRLKPADIAKFTKRLMALADEFEKSASTIGIAYSLNTSLYPAEPVNLPDQKIFIKLEQ